MDREREIGNKMDREMERKEEFEAVTQRKKE